MKGRGCKANGGETLKGVKDDKPPKAEKFNNSKVEKEADERAAGGRTGRKDGGHVHHEHGKHLGHAKHLGHISGEMHMNSGRKVRRSGGRAGSNFNPLSSAHKGKSTPGHSTEGEIND